MPCVFAPGQATSSCSRQEREYVSRSSTQQMASTAKGRQPKPNDICADFRYFYLKGSIQAHGGVAGRGDVRHVAGGARTPSERPLPPPESWSRPPGEVRPRQLFSAHPSPLPTRAAGPVAARCGGSGSGKADKGAASGGNGRARRASQEHSMCYCI